MVLEKSQLITIKGTRDGLTMMVDDSCSFSEVLEELREKIELNPQDESPVVPVRIELGNRYLIDDQRDQLKEIIERGNQFSVQTFHSNVVHRDEAQSWLEESEMKVFTRMVRSGQVLEATGDILLIGDVNPGGMIMTTGNIYIMGGLYGIAHAGVDGNHDAVIAASYMKPTQLRIANYISRAPDYESDGIYMECGYIDQNDDKITIERLQTLARKRSSLSGFERRMLNG